MSYTAFTHMREVNRTRFSQDVGPIQPDRHFTEKDHSLKGSALRFLHDRCEELLFSEEMTAAEAEGCYLGTGIAQNQIPYNMQMDVNRLCLERELERFIDSGVAEDAYNVYYCYLEMFLGRYGKSKKMVELLSEFESNGSSLLMKHRDHYSHSVYVFALGLAIYETNIYYRNAFKRFYGFNTNESDRKADHAAANTFLQFWGLTSLFHDIGYPFELPFEQVMSYFEVENLKRGKNSILIAYRDLDVLTGLSDEERVHLRELYGEDFNSIEELFAYDITQKLGEAYDIDRAALTDILKKKPTNPEQFGCFMDHAWFSTARLYRELVKPDEKTGESVGSIGRMHIDALSAILLHNSLYKFSISFYKSKTDAKAPLRMELHPLAYMLMLCDELQCWDRTAYGRNSRRELHPMGADFDFSDNAIKSTYLFDREEHRKIDAYEEAYQRWSLNKGSGDPPRLKAYSDMAEKEQRFRTDIEKIVDTSNIPLTVLVDVRDVDRKNKHVYLSSSNFLHLYDFAVALNARYKYQGDEDKVSPEILEKEFESLSLEYQISNINQAKSFSRYLNEIGCFYTDKPVDFEIVSRFTPEQTAVFAPMEHERWVREHRSMGWTSGGAYETVDYSGEGRSMYYYRKAFREQMRMHKLAMDGEPSEQEIFAHYDALPETEKGKDWEPFNSMLKLIKVFDGLRIYHFK